MLTALILGQGHFGIHFVASPRHADGLLVTGIANGRGVSLYTKEEIENTTLTGWVWKFRAKTPIPPELKLVNDKHGHYCMAPIMNMPVDYYKGLLEKMGMNAEKVWRKRA